MEVSPILAKKQKARQNQAGYKIWFILLIDGV